MVQGWDSAILPLRPVRSRAGGAADVGMQEVDWKLEAKKHAAEAGELKIAIAEKLDEVRGQISKVTKEIEKASDITVVVTAKTERSELEKQSQWLKKILYGEKEREGEWDMRRKLSKAERFEVYGKCQGHCAYCGCALEYKDMQVDHIVPLKRGGQDDIKNMLPSCRSCNHYKAALTAEEYKRYVEGIPGRLSRDSIPYQVGTRFGIIKPGKKVKFWYETHKQEKRVKSIREVDFSGLKAPFIAVYKHPEDFPGECVARIYETDKPTDTLMVKDTVEEIEADIKKYTSMTFMHRGAEDVLSLVGVWM